MSHLISIISFGVVFSLGACAIEPQTLAIEGPGTPIPSLPTLDPNYGSQSESEIFQDSSDSPVPTLDPKTVSRGEEVYLQYCAACHGDNLEGQPDWQIPLPDGSFRAPPHDSTGHTWHHSDEVLLNIIAEGSNPAFGGTMQGFTDVIDSPDRLAVLEFIKSHWGQDQREFQWRITSQ
jgi:mono/diheme cytochrome c family protein